MDLDLLQVIMAIDIVLNFLCLLTQIGILTIHSEASLLRTHRWQMIGISLHFRDVCELHAYFDNIIFMLRADYPAHDGECGYRLKSERFS